MACGYVKRYADSRVSGYFATSGSENCSGELLLQLATNKLPDKQLIVMCECN